MLMTSSIFIVGLASFLLTRWLADPHSPLRILDRPNERSLHSTPTSRTGGLAICGSLFIGVSIYSFVMDEQLFPLPVLYGALLIALLALLDDRFGMPAVVRLGVQLVAAVILVGDNFLIQGQILPGTDLNVPSDTIILLTILMTIWLVNLYNFMDGMDGFAGGMAVIGFGTFAVLGALKGDMHYAGAAMLICAAAAGFLWFNFPPARIFMGDTGSTTLGFLVAAFSIWASRVDIAAVWLTFLIFSPFIVDATATLLRRLVHGEPVWKAHRSHYYQRLVQLGWGHRRTVLSEYALMLFCSALAIIIHDQPQTIQWLAMIMVAFSYISAAVVVNMLEARRKGSIT